MSKNFFGSKEEQKVAKMLLKFNKTYSYVKLKNNKIMKKIINAKGNFYITPPFFCEGKNISLGEDVFLNTGCTILDRKAHIKVGDRVFLGPNVQIYGANHIINSEDRIAKEDTTVWEDVVIGNDVWIGGGAIICPGVTIGDNTTIGAGSVVVNDIPSNVVAVRKSM